jgi:hypothetical protein
MSALPLNAILAISSLRESHASSIERERAKYRESLRALNEAHRREREARRAVECIAKRIADAESILKDAISLTVKNEEYCAQPGASLAQLDLALRGADTADMTMRMIAVQRDELTRHEAALERIVALRMQAQEQASKVEHDIKELKIELMVAEECEEKAFQRLMSGAPAP